MYNLTIEGTVGCGKSTVSSFMSQRTGLKLYEELSNDDTIKLLDKFYLDQKRWSFSLQIHFLNERFKMIKDISKSGSGILDRSIFGDSIFAELLHEDGMMTDEEYRTYSTLLNNMLEHVKMPDLIIYLQCSTDVAIERINKRNRGYESKVKFGYWERLNKKYDEWFNGYVSSPKLLVNVDDIDIFDDEQRKEFLNRLENKLKETKNKF